MRSTINEARVMKIRRNLSHFDSWRNFRGTNDGSKTCVRLTILYSYLNTDIDAEFLHIPFGDIIEGCTFSHNQMATIENPYRWAGPYSVNENREEGRALCGRLIMLIASHYGLSVPEIEAIVGARDADACIDSWRCYCLYHNLCSRVTCRKNTNDYNDSPVVRGFSISFSF